MEKETVRRELKQKLSEISEAKKMQLSRKACNVFLKTVPLKKFDILLSYADMKTEISPHIITDRALRLNKITALPKTVPGTHEMHFFILDNTQPLESQLKSGPFSIREPCGKKEALFSIEQNAGKNICVIVPGLAFGTDGGRLGHGKGFYDRYLFQLKKACALHGGQAFLAGLCFGFQIKGSVPLEKTDVCMDAVICENRFLHFQT